MKPRVPAAAAWSDDRNALARALEWVGECDASACWRAEYRAQSCPCPDAGGRR